MTRRAVAIARFAVALNLRTPYTWVGGGLFVALAVLGLYASARAGRGWVLDPGLVVDGALLAAVFGVRSGLIVQRTSGLRRYLLESFASPVEHAAGMILSLLVSWALVCAGVLVLVLSGGGPAAAAWHAAAFALRTGVLLPFVLLTESITTVDLPFFVPGLAYVGLIMVLVLTLGEVESLAVLAPPMTPGDWGSTVPSLIRLVTVAGGGFGVVLLGVWIRERSRGWRPIA